MSGVKPSSEEARTFRGQTRPKTIRQPPENKAVFRMTSLVKWAVTLFLCSGALAELPAQQVPARLTLDEAIRMARLGNPNFQSVRNDTRVADWSVRSAYGELMPFANLSSSLSWQGKGEQQFGSLTTSQLGFGNEPSYYFSSYNAGLNYSIGAESLYRPGREKAARNATVALIDQAEANLVRDVTILYMDVLRQQEGFLLAQQELERARFNLRLAEGQLEVGTATPRDVRQAEVSVGRAEVTLLQAEFAVSNARIALLVILGAEVPQEFSVVSEFEVRAPVWSEAELVEMALTRNPGLIAERANENVANSDVKMARSSYYPSLSLSAGLSGFTREASSVESMISQARAGVAGQQQQCHLLNQVYGRLVDPLPAQDCSVFVFTPDQEQAITARNNAFPFDFTRQPARASLTVSVPVFQGFSRQLRVESARAAREDARHRLRGAELDLRAQIASSLAAVRTAYETERIEERNQAVAAEQLRLATEQYRVGSASFLDLVEAETVMAQADRERVASIYSYHDLLANLEALVGASLRP